MWGQRPGQADSCNAVLIHLFERVIIMNNGNNGTKAHKGLGKFKAVFLLAFLAVEGIFIYMFLDAGILAAKFTIPITLIVVALLLIFTRMIFAKNSVVRVIGLILAILMMVGTLFGINYIRETVKFLSDITKDKGYVVEEYDVVVRKDAPYKKLKDIKGENLLSFERGKNFDKAKKKLTEKVKVSFTPTEDMLDMPDKLMNKETKGIFVQSTTYDTLCDTSKGFRENSRILAKIKIKVKVKDSAKNVDVRKQSFNILISGIDTEGSVSTVSRSDVNMILTVNPVTRTLLFTSIPRDYYVNLPFEGKPLDKLTHTGIYGMEVTRETLEKNLGIDINYTMKVNFTTVRKLVDSIGGIDVQSEYSFDAGGFHYNEGMNHMNGDQALAFSRERYSFSDGDFQRNKNQQAVLEGIINKISTSTTLLTNYADILDSMKDNIQMNIPEKSVRALVKMQTEKMKPWNMKHQSITGFLSQGYQPCYSLGGANASVVMKDEESISAARKEIKIIMEEGINK